MRATKEEKKGEEDILSLNNLYPYLSKNHSPLVTEVDRSTKKILGILRYLSSAKEENPLDFLVELVHRPSGRKIPLDFVVVEIKKFGLDDAMLLEIRFPFVEPDVYILNIALSESQTGLEAVTSRTFRIR